MRIFFGSRLARSLCGGMDTRFHTAARAELVVPIQEGGHTGVVGGNRSLACCATAAHRFIQQRDGALHLPRAEQATARQYSEFNV